MFQELAQRVDKDDDNDDDDLSQKLGMKFVLLEMKFVFFWIGVFGWLVGWIFFWRRLVLLVCEEEFKSERIHMRI
jgi:hypothetical protein